LGLTRPFLQDPGLLERGSNFLILQGKMSLTRPFLQDFGNAAFCPFVFAVSGFVHNNQDVGPGTSANNGGVVFASFFGSLAGWLDSQGRLPVFVVARGSFWPADKPYGHSSVGFLLGDWDEKDDGNGHIGSCGSWFPSCLKKP